MFTAKLLSSTLAVLLCASSVVRSQAPLEPDRVMLGAWLDTLPGRDTPKQFGERLGHNAALIHMAEDLPLKTPHLPPVRLLDDANTNAILYLSVYPTVIPEQLKDGDIDAFVAQIATFARSGRGVFIRLAPEMNGSWQPYAQRPIAYAAMWKRIVTAIRANSDTTGRVAFIWAPNMQLGYPYEGGVYSMNATVSAAETQALDTNKNGRLDTLDDPYTPYYPGNEYVDWVGLSTYWFGADYPYLTNDVPPSGSILKLIHGTGPGAMDFYQLFAERNQKPFFITESGAAFHQYRIQSPANPVNTGAVAPGPGALAIKQAWWRQYLTNTTFLDAHPRLKAICLFEYQKPEEITFRDFQITNDSSILAAFKADFEKPEVQSRYLFATVPEKKIVTDPDAKNSGFASVIPTTLGALMASALAAWAVVF
ncbi:uncharacterized protein SPPG_07621 [Spizellomyces punctatus DAOM BR117]|uniref:GH26 domain-containing protein n=1 Tax=Spizellomyces punctatus (strain DAOM BR117) TaxID=645134 RepID=A0A0L0H8I8_SPIPD|nr:uncharacterized protein SPPG_07621 [Spizellomyces punctatus DAOM BR117]KNC97234.1 hypothetical protein SPPG_07621 [Spizellomyces punctatus DAOM BR117]|eukprot:XP_016605274.1 hypothetical protein SPPG_07621 [Spizellomyces punctatus DAOM BR117]